ncbi:MAG: hypothetical protein HUK07_05525 [Bacteroidaceae bacterium]|nr:hypothetical protein [Bacteroidaceae bacterium]
MDKQLILEVLKATHADKLLIADKERELFEAQNEYTKATVDRTKEQMDALYGMMSPLEDFGSAVGSAFATMSQDAEKGKQEFNDAIAEMIKAFAKQTLEMLVEYTKRRAFQKINDKLVQKQMKKEGQDEQKIFDASGAARVATESLIQGALTTVKTEGGKAQNQVEETTAQTSIQTKQTQTQSSVNMGLSEAIANLILGIAGGSGKIIESLGWWGIPLVAVITALLGGLMSWVTSSISNLFGSSTSTSTVASTPKTKLTSGMLTYDSGNIQAFSGVIDGKSYPVVGSDGNVYAAKDGGQLATGLIKDPITTFVNGQPALVAEEGPEIVVGRETTAAVMMSRPDILRDLVQIDRNRSGRTYKAFADGNLDQFVINTDNGNGMSAQDAQQLRETITALSLTLSALQSNGIPAHINMFGRGGLAESNAKAQQFMQRNSGDRLYRR